MNPVGDFNPANYSASNQYLADTGTNWEYIRIINSSPYLLQVTLNGQGSKKIPENFLEDIRITRAYNGKLLITPQANFPAQAIAVALSSLVTVECYLSGEILYPVAQPVTTLANVGNALIQASQVQQLGFPTGTFVLQAGADLNPVNASIVLYNDGHGFMGALPGAELSWDTQGNLSVQTLTAFQVKVDNVPILVATNQETGSCGLVENNCVNTSTIGGRQNFKTQMTNVPTSISFVDITTLNAGPISTPNIDKTGFTIVWTPAAAGQSFRIETYTTVGN